MKITICFDDNSCLYMYSILFPLHLENTRPSLFSDSSRSSLDEVGRLIDKNHDLFDSTDAQVLLNSFKTISEL